jgi:hypothetical protein
MALGIVISICSLMVILSIFRFRIMDDLNINYLYKPFIPYVLSIPFVLVIYSSLRFYELGVRLCSSDAARILETDRRRPVLFLRSFYEDNAKGSYRVQKNINHVTMVASLYNFLIGRSETTFEQEFAKFFRTIGPVVAVGKPGERLVPLGAARLYVTGDNWEAEVLALLAHAQAVVLKIGLTPGTLWEFAQCFSRVEPTRLLLVMPYLGVDFGPHEPWRRVYETFRHEASLIGVFLPEPPRRNSSKRPETEREVAFIRFDKDWTPYWLRMRYLPLEFVTPAPDLSQTLSSYISNLGSGSSTDPGQRQDRK